MSIRQRITNIFNPTQKNSSGLEIARDFLHRGTGAVPVYGDWSELRMTRADGYKGFMYGAVTRRASKVVRLSKSSVKTLANDQTAKAAKDKKIAIQHPYLETIDSSLDFADGEFWREIQSYIDIRGEYFLMAIRGKLGNKTGPVKEFKLINPFDVTVIRDGQKKVIGYVETRDGQYREIEPHMIIHIRAFNPLSRIDPFSMADAANDAQFGLRETSETIRSAQRRNRKYPGVILMGGDGVQLDDVQVKNFKSRMTKKASQEEPMFATSKGGKGSGLNWNDMQIDLSKSKVTDSTEINLNEMSAVTGVSKTKYGIEQSGTTRDTAEVQDDLFIEDHALPALDIILDALNQDYKRYYPEDYKRFGYKMVSESPLQDNKDADAKDIENRTKSFDLFTSLLEKGYDSDTAAAFASGEKDLAEIGKPKVDSSQTDAAGTLIRSGFEPESSLKEAGLTPIPHLGYLPVTLKDTQKDATENSYSHIPAIANKMETSTRSTLAVQQASLKNSVLAVEQHLVVAALSKVSQNVFEDQSDIIDESTKKKAVSDLDEALTTFYRIVVPLAAPATMNRRLQELGITGKFSLDKEVKQYIELTASRAAAGHVETVLEDILDTVKTTEERLVQGEMKKIVAKPGQSAEEILQLARKKALEGNGRETIASAIRQEYGDTISKVRATTIARTETNRAYNRSQYEADRQLLAQNDLTHRAYKKWVTRSDNPCEFCSAKAKEPAIPFTEPFAQVGDVVKAIAKKADGTTTVRQLHIGFEDCMAGELHPNGECTYQLSIE